LFGFLVIMVLLEAFVFRNVDFYGYSPGFIGQMAELKASFAQAEEEEITVAVFGDSQSMDAIRPEQLAEAMGLEPENIFNFSLSGASAFDLYKTYEAVRDRLPRLEQAVVVVNEHQFNNAEAADDIKFKFTANLRERLAAMDADNYGDLLLGWLSKAYDMRSVWTMMLEKYRNGELREEIPVHAGGLPPVTWSPSSSRTAEYAEETADRWFVHYDLEGVRTEAFEALVRELADRGVRVTIVQLPRSQIFEEIIREKYAAEQERYLQLVSGIAERYGAEWIIMPNGELSLEKHFRDTNHVNPAGARWVSAYLGGLLKNGGSRERK
jgi:hypothetical protein